MTNLGPEFRFTALTKQDRTDIVNGTTDFADPTAAPTDATLLLLSALGASLDLEGHWAESTRSNLAQWRQVSSQGRDHYVRIVRRGYLFPVGHPAVLVEIVERVFIVDPNGHVAAYPQLRRFRVINPLKVYPALGRAFGLREWPFSALVATEVSPNILLLVGVGLMLAATWRRDRDARAD